MNSAAASSSSSSPKNNNNETPGVGTATVGNIPQEEENDQDDQDKSNKRKLCDVAATSPPRRRRQNRATTRMSWEERISTLKAFKAENGHLLIPIRYKPNPSLGKFIHNTREQYKLFHNKTKKGYKKKCSLTAERIQELEDLGFVWTTERTKRQDNDWNGRFEQLLQYKEQHGNCLVPHGYREDTVCNKWRVEASFGCSHELTKTCIYIQSFSEWIHRQRTTYASYQREKKPNKTIQDRINKLKEIGFVFTVQ